ncbi:MAG: heparin lyase I family protein [Nocardioidaceae bacterium]|mgnify:CR=1 FL=1
MRVRSSGAAAAVAVLLMGASPVDPGAAAEAAVTQHRPPRTLFADDFDHEPPWGDAPPWSTTDWVVQQWELPPSYPALVRIPGPRSGWSMSARSAPGRPNPHRTELAPDSATFHNRLRDDRAYTVSFDTYVRRYDRDNAPSWMIISQFHGTPHRKRTGEIAWECVSGRNPVSLTLARGRWGVNINNHPARVAPAGALADRDVWTHRLTLRSWVHWRIRLVPSQHRRGLVKVWFDGRLVAQRHGRNKDRDDQCGRRDTPIVFFKIGTYKDETNTGTQVVLYDNVRIRRG